MAVVGSADDVLVLGGSPGLFEEAMVSCLSFLLFRTVSSRRPRRPRVTL